VTAHAVRLWGLLMAVSGASAAVLHPNAEQIAAATASGRALAAPHEGYRLKDYVLYEVKNARGIDVDDGDVDAIVIATPLERTRHAAFLAAFAGRAIGPTEARASSGLPDNQLEIIVFAHGADRSDRRFAQGFTAASLIEGSESLAVALPIAGEPKEAVYPLAPGDRRRFVAIITYRFDLSRFPQLAGAKARLRFQDASGKSFDLPVDFSAFP
jgi:hypothetical protein